MADQGDDDNADAATRAFQGLHAEVIVMRRLVEGLPHEWEDKRPADYSPDLGAMRKALIAMERRLGTIEAQPALKETPETHAARIENAGKSVFCEAERVLGRAIIETRDTGRELAAMIGHMRGQAAQRDFALFWGSISAGCALLLGLVGSPFIASHLPFGWNGNIAAIVMNADRWNAGQKLMRRSDPASWNRMVADWSLLTKNRINAKAMAACETKAAKFYKAQDCRIAVPAGK